MYQTPTTRQLQRISRKFFAHKEIPTAPLTHFAPSSSKLEHPPQREVPSSSKHLPKSLLSLLQPLQAHILRIVPSSAKLSQAPSQLHEVPSKKPLSASLKNKRKAPKSRAYLRFRVITISKNTEWGRFLKKWFLQNPMWYRGAWRKRGTYPPSHFQRCRGKVGIQWGKNPKCQKRINLFEMFHKP